MVKSISTAVWSVSEAAPDSNPELDWVSGADGGSPKASRTAWAWGHILGAVRCLCCCICYSHIGCYDCKRGRHCRPQRVCHVWLTAQRLTAAPSVDVVLNDIMTGNVADRLLEAGLESHIFGINTNGYSQGAVLVLLRSQQYFLPSATYSRQGYPLLPFADAQ